MTNVIVCKDLKKTYINGDMGVEVLRGLNFNIEKGEFVAIMGPSGSGKSTLMNILGCLDSLTSGKYELNGQDIADLSEDRLAEIRNREIGFIFQSYNLLNISAKANVELPLIYDREIQKHERTQIVEKSLRSAGLEEERWIHKPNQMSGGQEQRVAIARALVTNPSIILADEPTGNLDSKTSEIVLDTFKTINKEEGKTIIMITHDPEVAEHAQRIIHIRDGMIKEPQ